VRITGNRPGRSSPIPAQLLVLDQPGKAGTNTMLTHIQIASAKPSAKPFNLTDPNACF